MGDVDQYHLNDLSRKTERYIKRKIRSLVLSRDEYKEPIAGIEETTPCTDMGSKERVNLAVHGLKLEIGK